jgi:branched-chain amino acid transport system ATP-binding protein
MGEDITKKPPYSIARLGVGYAPSERRLFGSLTARQNMEIAERTSPEQDSDPWTLSKVYEIFPGLQDKEDQKAGRLSGGQQQMLTIARALMGNPQLLLLDEPTTGLSPGAIKTLGDSIQRLKSEGLSILLAEQNIEFGHRLGDTFYIMDTGKIRFQGIWDDLSKDDNIVKEYLAV